jgi:hypothetical protein
MTLYRVILLLFGIGISAKIAFGACTASSCSRLTTGCTAEHEKYGPSKPGSG